MQSSCLCLLPSVFIPTARRKDDDNCPTLIVFRNMFLSSDELENVKIKVNYVHSKL